MLSGVALDPHQNSGEGSDDPKDKWTDRKLAKESGTSHNTLSRIAKIEEKATPEQKEAGRGTTQIQNSTVPENLPGRQKLFENELKRKKKGLP